MNTDSQDITFQLNEFYRDNYRRTMKWLSFMIIVCAIFSAVLAWMCFDQQQPAYYAAVTTGEVVPMHALSEPVVTQDFVIEWAALTGRMIYNLSFDTYQQQLAAIQDRFTPEGWAKIMGALKASGMIDELTNSRVIISAVVSGPPVVLAQLILHGRYTWRVQMPVLVTYTSASA